MSATTTAILSSYQQPYQPADSINKGLLPKPAGKRRGPLLSIIVPTLTDAVRSLEPLIPQGTVTELSSGNFANVFLAKGEEKSFVIKQFYRKNTLDEITHERNINMMVDHPGIPKCRETIYNYNGNPALVMEFAPGKTLKELSTKNFQQLINNQIIITRKIFEILKHLEDQQIIHRDLHPKNILFDPDTKKVSILDFGIAKKIDVLAKGNITPLTGGIPKVFLSPENLDQKPDQTTQSNVWAMGITLFELFTDKKIYSLINPVAYTSEEPETAVTLSITDAKLKRESGLCDYRQVENELYRFDPYDSEKNILDERIRRVIIGALKINPEERIRPDEALAILSS